MTSKQKQIFQELRLAMKASQYSNLSKREKMEFCTQDIQYRILGVDFEEKLRFKIPEWAILFEGRIKWHKQQKKDSLLIF